MKDPINPSDLARVLLRWEKIYIALQAQEVLIEQAILDLEKTVTVGNVRASYSGGRKTYGYETAGINAPQVIIDNHSKTVIKTDWKAVCEEALYLDVPFIKSDPSVTLKLLGGT